MVVFGVGMGMTLQIVVVAVQNAVERRDIGQRHLGGELLPQHRRRVRDRLLGTVLVSRLGFWLPRLVPPHSGLNLSQSFTITPDALRALPPAVRAGVVDSFVRSLHVVFMVGIPLAGLAFVCALLLKDAPLHDSVAKDPGAADHDAAAGELRRRGGAGPGAGPGPGGGARPERSGGGGSGGHSGEWTVNFFSFHLMPWPYLAGPRSSWRPTRRPG